MDRASNASGPRAFGLAALYLLLALAWTWPLPLHLTNRFTHDPGDPLLVTYLIWWNAHAVPFTQAWWNIPMFWPSSDALALTEHAAGLSPFTTPVQWLGGSPLLAYNLLLIASTWWTLLATHALVRRLTHDHVAAACAAAAFAFAPYRTAQLAHMQLYACWWIPLALCALHAYAEDGRRRWLAVFAVSWLFQALTNAYSLFHLPLLFAAWVVMFLRHRPLRGRAIAIAAAWVGASLLLMPVLLHYYRVQQRLGLTRSLNEIIFYSAHVRDLLSATPNLLVWRTPAPPTTEAYLFPGVTVIALVVAGSVARVRQRAFWFYAATAVASAWLCLGPSERGLSLATLAHPYDLLLWVPGFRGIRVPPRFFMITALSLAVAAAIAVAHFRTRGRRPMLIALVIAGLAADGLIAGMPLGVPPGSLPDVPRDARLLALPYDDAGAIMGTLYRSMAAGLPVVNGYAGYIPPYARAVQWALERRDASVLTELRRGHPLYVIVTDAPTAAAWTTFIESQPGATMSGVSSAGRIYAMPPSGFARQTTVGAPLDTSHLSVDGSWIVADLGAPVIVRALDVRTRGHVTLLAQTVRAETSMDGVEWTLAAEELSGGLAFNGVLSDPLGVPVRLLLPDVRARYVRVNGAAFGTGAVTLFGP